MWWLPTCNLAVETPAASFGVADNELHGISVDSVGHGAAIFFGPPTAPSVYETVAGSVGAFSEGAVRTRQLETGAPSSTATSSTLSFPGGSPSPGSGFGASVLGVDLLTHHDDAAVRGTYGLLSGGEEILVGAPADGPGADGPGVVYWYYPAFDGSAGSDPTTLDLYRWEYGGSYTPLTAAGNARFGASSAASPVMYGSQAAVFAVGAPGESRVYVYRPATAWTPGGSFGVPASADPFDTTAGGAEYVIDATSTVDATGSPIGTLGFGAEVHMADLDADGIVDLVVGAPASGEVTVFPGVGGSGNPFSSTRVLLTGPPQAFDLGASLASGFLHETPGYGAVPTLVAGAPGTSAPTGGAGERGAVCQFHFAGGFASAPTGRCDRSPFFAPTRTPCTGSTLPTDFSVSQSFGASVAVGNFIRHDTFGKTTSDEARLEELAVGAPGSEVPERDLYRFLYTAGAASNCGTEAAYFPTGPTSGSVSIFESSFGGGSEVSLDGRDHRFLQTVTPRSIQVGGGFGSALVAADLFPNSNTMDLVIGANGADLLGTNRGEVLVTRSSLPVRDFMADYMGRYRVLDSADDMEDVRIMPVEVDGVGTRYIFVMDQFHIIIREGGGDPSEALCTHDDGDTMVNPDFDGAAILTAATAPVDLSFDLDPSDPSDGMTSTPLEFVDAAGDPVLRFDADIVHDGVLDTFTITLDSPRVRSGSGMVNPWPLKNCDPVVAGGAFVLDSYSPNACE